EGDLFDDLVRLSIPAEVEPPPQEPSPAHRLAAGREHSEALGAAEPALEATRDGVRAGRLVDPARQQHPGGRARRQGGGECFVVPGRELIEKRLRWGGGV